VNATEAPWAAHFRMWDYVTDELPALLAENFALDMERQGITGHSMGGHGALTMAMSLPGRFKSVSAFAPISHPTGSDWGRKQLRAYLGEDESTWAPHDATLFVFVTTLFVDADACPVKAEAERVATRHGVPMKLVSNGGLRMSQNPLVEVVIVPDGPDVADMWIVERCGPGDVVITSDIPLAAKCVEAGARVLKHSGERLTEANVREALAMRPFRQGGGKSFGKADRSRFLDALERELRAVKG